jgi:hypothetical protein
MRSCPDGVEKVVTEVPPPCEGAEKLSRPAALYQDVTSGEEMHPVHALAFDCS